MADHASIQLERPEIFLCNLPEHIKRLACRPRFDYARMKPRAKKDGDTLVFSGGRTEPLRLSGCVPVTAGDGEATAEFELKFGEERSSFYTMPGCE